MAGCLVLSLFVASCRPGDSDDHEEGAAAQTVARVQSDSPAKTARLLHELYQRRDYDGIAPMIVQPARAQTIDLLQAIAEVLDADASLRGKAEEYYGVPYYATWSLASIANNLGVFSKRVKFINQKHRGAEASVTLQEADHVPLVHARFELHDNCWLLRPDETPPTLPADLRGLAASLREVERDVLSGVAFETYVQSFFDKAVPQMRRVVMSGMAAEFVAAGEQPE